MKSNKDTLIYKALNAKRESKYVEFKESFDVDAAQDWCEIIKDIIALTNSGGGILIIGLKNNGTLSGFDCSKILSLDPVTLTDKIYKYTNISFQDFEIEEISKGRRKIAGIIIFESRIPIPFCKPGTYAIPDGKQKTAFGQGTLYFRHGAKSETCNSDDLKEVIERNLEFIKKSWLGNIRKVVNAPSESTVAVLPPNVVVTTSFAATPIRITNDEKAPTFKLEDPNTTHPYRGKEIIEGLQRKVKVKINSFHLRCIRQEYKIDETRPDFFYKPKFGTPQFSEMFLDWLIELYKSDNQVFEKIRDKNLKH